MLIVTEQHRSVSERPSVRRVLLVSPSAKRAGSERAVAGLARHLRSYGWQPAAALLEPGPLADWLEEAGCDTEVLSSHRTRQIRRSVATVARLAEIIRSTDSDLVLSNMEKGHIFAGLAALSIRRPAVLWQQGIPAGWHRIPKGSLEKISAIVPKVSILASCDAAVSAQRSLTRAPVHKIPLGIAVREVAASSGRGREIRAQFGWRNETVIGIVGRLQPWKGQETFLKAAVPLAAQYRQLRFCIVGGAILGWEGSYEDDLKAFVAREPLLRDRVYFAGHQDNVYDWMDALDVVVHASFGEPFGLVVVEAMALAKPVVATNVGGPAEIVVDGVSGLLVSPGDTEGLVAAVSRVLSEPGLAGRLSIGARARAERFSEEEMTARVAAVLDNLVPPK